MFNCMFCKEVFSQFKYLKCHVKLKHIDQLYSEGQYNFSNCTISYSILRRISTTYDTESSNRCKTNDKEATSSNDSTIKITSSQTVNLIDHTASLESRLNAEVDSNVFLENFSSKILNLTLSLITIIFIRKFK